MKHDETPIFAMNHLAMAVQSLGSSPCARAWPGSARLVAEGRRATSASSNHAWPVKERYGSHGPLVFYLLDPIGLSLIFSICFFHGFSKAMCLDCQCLSDR